MTAYYNEFDPFAAAWLRELIADGLIATGVVDERSIEDVPPNDLHGFTQCHFFAGIGVWSLALRQAGWPDDRPVWTGSCPCQPFSSAGKGAGFADERHLWPAFFHLINACRPVVAFGEQVASKDADPWIDLVQADMEALDYAFGAVPFPAAGVGAPHIRDRLYWVADAGGARLEKRLRVAGVPGGTSGGNSREASVGVGVRNAEGMGNTHRDDARRYGRNGADLAGGAGRLANADGRNSSTEREQCCGQQRQQQENGRPVQVDAAGPVSGLWADADWLFCRDGKWRPVEPGTFPLVDAGVFRNRVGLLRGAGNAISLGQAQTFIEAFLTC